MEILLTILMFVVYIVIGGLQIGDAVQRFKNGEFIKFGIDIMFASFIVARFFDFTIK